MNRLSAAICAAPLLVFLLTAQAQMRCGTELIETGDLAAKVLQECGEPYSRDNTLFGDDQWIYNFGPNEFMMILTIRGGEVIDIEPGDYGFVPTEKPSP